MNLFGLCYLVYVPNMTWNDFIHGDQEKRAWYPSLTVTIAFQTSTSPLLTWPLWDFVSSTYSNINNVSLFTQAGNSKVLDCNIYYPEVLHKPTFPREEGGFACMRYRSSKRRSFEGLAPQHGWSFVPGPSLIWKMGLYKSVAGC